MTRNCSEQESVRTRWSPPYRETIRWKVFHGRKSMTWANSILPLYMLSSGEINTRRLAYGRCSIQVGDTIKTRKTYTIIGFQQNTAPFNRTVVGVYSFCIVDLSDDFSGEIPSCKVLSKTSTALVLWVGERWAYRRVMLRVLCP